MYLKALHMVGFKSFADKTTLHFDRGVTAVVGPNGCGKSNVLDAIRWVLGEQSAKALRGGNMQDVIFGGTDSRKPLSLAEVSLTFAECEAQLGMEFHEVTITRRVFRDGQSEYEMNKTPCRLRDIHQLFMDTGIGRTAYSIMEQGKIDQILSSRPEDRRAIFEEAAGITKFKSQRKEALKKLENTEANLIRLADIIREVKRQIGSLQRQAGKAKRYQELFAELKTSELKLARYKFDAVHGVISELEANVESTKTEVESLAVELEEGEMDLSGLREQVGVIEAEFNDIRERQNQSRNAVERAQQVQEMNRSRVEEFTELRDQSHREVASSEERTRVQEEQLESLNSQLESLQDMKGQTEAEYNAQREEEHMLAARISSTENERAEEDERQATLAQKLNHLENQLAALEIQQRNFLFRVEAIKTEQSDLAVRLAEAEAQRLAHQEQCTTAEARVQEHKTSLSEAGEELRTLENHQRSTEQALRQQANTRQQKLAEQTALEKMQANGPQTSASSQDLASLTGAHRLHGALSSHLRVTPGAEEVVARLLGEALNALVVEDAAAVEEILASLGTTKSLALLPLHAPRSLIFSTSAAQHALHCVQADELATPVVQALLAHSFITNTVPEALALRAADPLACVATRDGALIQATGLVRIGVPVGDGAARFARQNRLTELAVEISTEQQREQEAQTAVESAQQQVTEARGALETQRAQLQEAEVLLATLRQQYQSAQAAATELERRHATTSQELSRLAAQDEADHARKNELLASILDARQETEIAKAKLSELAIQLDALADEENTQRTRVTELKITLATQTQQCEGLQQQREPIANRLIELREFAESRRRAAGDYEIRISQAHAEIERATLQQAEAFQQATLLASEASEKQAQKNSLQAQVEERDAMLRTKRRYYSEVQARRSAEEVRLATQKMQIEALRERIQRAYQLTLEELPELNPEEPVADWDAFALLVDEQRQRVDSMGPVNLEAIAEYDELEQRHTFLTEQESDMIKAKDQLLAAIAEINLTTKVLFAETFEKIKVNFQETFTQLFGGGKGGLVLSDEADPLESGIEIIARPPGKQPTSITLLSGGEKTMTAVALLFAIYMVKPSPFCVLDEMDAPLDESNIGRFIKMLNRFVQQSQFVVITHNKKTISAADVVFGVTMEEHGVSKLVSVKFAKPAEKPSAQLEVAVDPAIPSVAETFGKMVEVRV